MADINVTIIQEKVPHYRLPLFNQLAKATGIELTVAHSTPNNLSDSAKFNEVILKCIKIGKFSFQKGAWNLVSKSDIAVVMFDLRWISILPLLLLSPRKIVLWGHGFGRNKLAKKIRFLLAKRAAGIVLYEEPAVDEFLKLGYPQDKIYCAGNTVHIPNAGIIEASKTQFLFVGRLQIRKRVDLLLKAFAKIKKCIPSCYGITIVGDGEISRDLKELANDLEISDQVSFLGEITSDDKLAEIFSQSIAYVSPGHVGLGVLHSFAYGVPVITHKSDDHAPEINNVINDQNGYIYEGSNSDLAGILQSLVNSPDKVKQLGENAFNHYQNKRSMNKMVERFLTAINTSFTRNNSK